MRLRTLAIVMSPYGLDMESRNNHRTAPNPRHSGLDPESSPFPVMDPGSMSPRGLGDVRDDVCSALPTNVLHVIPGLPRNPKTTITQPQNASFRADPESSPSLIHSRFPRFSVTNAPFVTCNMEAQFALSHSSECPRAIVPEGKHGPFPRKRSGCYFPAPEPVAGMP